MAALRRVLPATRCLLLGMMLAACTPGQGPLSVTVGPTSIPGGDALGAGDITVRNEHLAIAFAVDTAAPWGVARGGIIDVAVVQDGVVSADRASLVDFMPNDWSAWPSTYQRVTVSKQTADAVVITTERDWGEVQLVTTFALAAGDDKVHMVTRMSNAGADALTDLQSGYVLWPNGGHIFGMPGLHGVNEGSNEAALAGWSAFYGADWVLGLHASFDDRNSNDARDRYLLHTLAPGESRRFEAWLQVGADGELAPLVSADIQINDLAAGRISGAVTTSGGDKVSRPAVIAEKMTASGPQAYAWTLGSDGEYSFLLPAGSYRLYATADAHSRTRPVDIDVQAGQTLLQDFRNLDEPGSLTIKVRAQDDDRPLDARVTIAEGDTPLIGYFGKATFFTELDPVGELTMRTAPGDYHFRVAVAEGFTAAPVDIDITVAPGASQVAVAKIAVLANPAAEGWYGADLHHHSDVLDGYTEPEFVLRSELAAGLDITFLSDHDSVINNPEMLRLATTREVPFIAASEFSPSWAHFNAYPLDAGETIRIDVGKATAHEIFDEARRMGADVVQVNHPYIEYGYFRSQEREIIPGGFAEDFDLVEVSSTYPNEETIEKVWQFWNEGRRAYFSAGSDAHDVWAEISGAVRLYAHVDGALTIDKFIAAVRAGQSYASSGPLVFPERLFGEQLQLGAGTSLPLEFSVQAVNGLARVELIERGVVIASRDFDGPTQRTSVSFIVHPESDGWYSLVVSDAQGKTAYTNPYWVDVAPAAGSAR